jgi:hypothetical protein
MVFLAHKILQIKKTSNLDKVKKLITMLIQLTVYHVSVWKKLPLLIAKANLSYLFWKTVIYFFLRNKVLFDKS